MTNLPFPSITTLNRPNKPRRLGITMVIDKNMGINATKDLIETAGQYIDLVKMGWGTSCITNTDIIKRKIELFKSAQIKVLPGGTLLEVAFDQEVTEFFFTEAKALGFDAIEISNGIHPYLEMHHKHKLIHSAKKHGFYTLSEVGRKLPEEDNQLSVTDRIEEAVSDLKAGADKIIMESRESGTVGIYNESGKINSRMAYQLFQSIDPDDIIWEAPHKNQQTWLLQQLGPHVNLGNISPSDALSLETLRLGLRADTMREHRKNATIVYLELGTGGALRAQRRGDIVVVVDAIRASTTILQALQSGAKQVKPVIGAEELHGDITAGERGGEKLPFTDYGNSPTEFMKIDLTDRELVLSSTNGTECIRSSKGADNRVFIGSVTNASAIGKLVNQLSQESGMSITLLAAGRNNLPAIEDRIGVTEILKHIESPIIRGILDPFYSENIERDFLSSDSGVNLAKLGYAEDIIHCSKINLFTITPEFDGTYIIA